MRRDMPTSSLEKSRWYVICRPVQFENARTTNLVETNIARIALLSTLASRWLGRPDLGAS